MIPVTVDQLFLSNMGFVVLLKGGDDERALPIFIGQSEAQSIAIWLNRIDVPRPLTHDLLKNLLDYLECRLLRIEICDLREGTFYARLVLDVDGTEAEIDSRPSDAISLALRADAPIFVNETVMERAGRVFSPEELGESRPVGEAPAASPPHKPRTRLETLQAELDRAVEEERYEEAAGLRDRITELKNQHTEN